MVQRSKVAWPGIRNRGGAAWGSMGQQGDTAFVRGVVLHMELPFGLIFGMKNLRNCQKTFFTGESLWDS